MRFCANILLFLRKIVIDFDFTERLENVVVATYSYTGEDSAEIICHGSPYIQSKILEILVNMGARLADAGEYTMRAFINNKMDLTQAEAVADLISSQNEAEHKVAMNHLKGGFSRDLQILRFQRKI